MSSDIAIKVENLSKCYQIYEKPQDRLKQSIYSRVRKFLGRHPKNYFREFWALREISFEVKKGETVGIIGRNGSGKSTLLQLICGTLNPTGGGIHVNGKVAALLELGSGFNPEFTGRENVYMNASVLGLSKHEIDERFEQITTFADIGDFIDQPIKTYSSGMVVRLAFAVIAHVDADILVIDEALAVGDAIFTQKCMRYIRKFRETGTLFFVSHDMGSVLNLCKRSLWINSGRMMEIGEAEDVAKSYLEFTSQQNSSGEYEFKKIEHLGAKSKNIETNAARYESKLGVISNLSSSNGWQTGKAEITSVRLWNLERGCSDIFEGGEMVRLSIEGLVNEEITKPIVGFLFRDKLGQDLFGENTIQFTRIKPQSLKKRQHYCATFEFELPMLPNGQYSVMASFAEGDQSIHTQHHWLHDALIINVYSSKVRWGLVGLKFNLIELENKNE
ncbi:ABC transporter ATP-binding protein [Polynucleobacter sp. Fuers-14]|uniref:ABC transporter ATP-binding protein n=1 Tax=Polynucleobacter sp. Fuers-14 TaxID=1758364 RepID=UPI001C0B658E|nr:ABC transporter ATP-binding protein [Polynucleobacter sp. Fuers-14]MBU3641079.1 ABC transporter ATP-binding protein [Polynucleobacter sp. Fuers-14]